MFSTPSRFGTPQPQDRSRIGSRIPSLRSSRQQTPIPPQSSRNSTPQSSRTPLRSRGNTPSNQGYTSSKNTSAGPQLVPLWQANAGLVINGEINGFRLQILFSTIHKSDWMTQTTARRCGIQGIPLRQEYYLENTYMDHRYNQRTRNPINLRVGTINNQDIIITTHDIVPIVQDTNFYNRSQSLQDQRNRIFFLIGMDTIRNNRIKLQVNGQKSVIHVPNPNYQPPAEQRYYKFNALQYPDLTNQANRDFNVRNVNRSKL